VGQLFQESLSYVENLLPHELSPKGLCHILTPKAACRQLGFIIIVNCSEIECFVNSIGACCCSEYVALPHSVPTSLGDPHATQLTTPNLLAT
jgi:hypothetical protein